MSRLSQTTLRQLDEALNFASSGLHKPRTDLTAADFELAKVAALAKKQPVLARTLDFLAECERVASLNPRRPIEPRKPKSRA